MEVRKTTRGIPVRNPAHKVVAIAVGEAHTIILSGNGKVYSWGRGTFGRLGNVSESDENFPVQIRKWDDEGSYNQKPINFVGVAAGAYHSLALADDGSVWCWGYNAYGQLGFDGENVSVPRQLDKFAELDSPDSLNDESNEKVTLKICTIEADGMMSLAIDNLGVLWIWGNIPQPSNLHDGACTLTSVPNPTPMWDFYGHTVVKVACGNEHIVALVEEHSGDDLVCYTWGNNGHGQLGLGDTHSRSHPQIVAQFKKGSDWRPYDISCGTFHTVVLTLKKCPSDRLESVCWTFGLGENGQLGHGTTQSTSLPEPVRELPKHAYFVAVDCGFFHTSVVSSAGEVWSWGMKKGMGLCPNTNFPGMDHEDATLPLQISFNGLHGPNFLGPKEIVCGAAHTILVADDGYKLYSWGRGWSGVLGDGKAKDSNSPILVLWPPLLEDFNNEFNYTSMAPRKSENGDKVEEIKTLQLKLLMMERYTTVLHGSIFGSPFEEGKILSSLLESNSFDVTKAWESMLEATNGNELRRLEVFYKNMLEGVKEKIITRRIQGKMMSKCKCKCNMQSSDTNRR